VKVVLALDLSTKTGWCVGAPGSKPAFGRWLLGSSSATPAAPWCGLLDCLADAVVVHRPTRIDVEAPLPATSQKSQDIARLLIGLADMAQIFCFRRELPHAEHNAATVRRVVLGAGHGRAPKSEIIGWCRARGFDVIDDNAADAIVLWHYVTRPASDGLRIVDFRKFPQ
jgi:crossover junction endodeoxyribonuclease RuvC